MGEGGLILSCDLFDAAVHFGTDGHDEDGAGLVGADRFQAFCEVSIVWIDGRDNYCGVFALVGWIS